MFKIAEWRVGSAYCKALGVRPCGFRESFNCNPSILIKPALVHKIGCFLSTFWHYEVCTEPICCCPKWFQWILPKSWYFLRWVCLQSIFCTVHTTLYVNTKISHWQQKEMFSTNPALCKQAPTPWFSSTSKTEKKSYHIFNTQEKRNRKKSFTLYNL